MKIYQLINAPQRRGGEVFAALLTRELIARGCDAQLVSVLPPKLGTSAELEGLSVQVLTQSSGRIRSIVSAAVALRRRIVAEPRSERIILQANIGDTLLVAVLAAAGLRGRVRIVYRNANMMSQFLRDRRSSHLIYSRALARVDLIAAVSDECGSDVIAHHLASADQVQTIENGVVLKRQRLANAQGRPPVLLHVGAFVPEKNHAGLLRIFSRIHKAFPDARLVLAGSGPLEAEVKAQVAAASLAGAVEFAGSVNDIERRMQSAAVLVLPSLIEGMPGVILEAFASGLPVVANATGAVPTLLNDGCGHVLEIGDEAGFADAVIALLGDPKAVDAMTGRAQARVRERYDIKVIAAQFSDAYEALFHPDNG